MVDAERAKYTAVAIPWDSGWDVVILGPDGNVVVTCTASRLSDVEWVARTALRRRLTRASPHAELTVEARDPQAGGAGGGPTRTRPAHPRPQARPRPRNSMPATVAVTARTTR